MSKARKDLFKELKTIIRYECDEPMARHKGYFPCNHQCKSCLACILTLPDGTREHVAVGKEKEIL